MALAPGAAAPLAAAASLIAGLGYGLFLLLAAEVLCSFSLLRIFLFMTGAMLLGVGLAFSVPRHGWGRNCPWRWWPCRYWPWRT